MEESEGNLVKGGAIRVRFAPSPTGALHIGGVRTALFNYLFAKKYGGIFVLRIEDTDKERNQKVFEKDIKQGLKWLGFTWDEEYKQSQRLPIYKQHLKQLIAEKKAYLQDGAYYFKTPTEGKIIVPDLIRGDVEFEASSFDDFVKFGGWKGVSEAGKLRIEGRDYVMQEGDVVEFMVGK